MPSRETKEIRSRSLSVHTGTAADLLPRWKQPPEGRLLRFPHPLLYLSHSDHQRPPRQLQPRRPRRLPLHLPITVATAAATMGSAAAYYYTGCEHDYQPHFLDSCSLCRRPLSQNSDIFMYRGNTPFCSQECRQEQIEMDEATGKKWKMSSSSLSSSSKRSSAVR
ncbi:uncharacterized protein LOC131003594 [Salvia miltiorrhiza]|uniref:uncharacterized protein LOC131003594 n=1 Tax=Salvia miltiorrhiza TaxID=226208 RepID=UPI0025ACB12A|nr:uncharacterized protein LOC131003594 [Salvia miltiorrhiza]